MSAAVSLFDFDGTLVRKDSTRVLAGQLVRLRPWRGLLALPAAARLRLSRTPGALQRAKCSLLGALLRGLSEGRAARAMDRAAELMRRERRPRVLDALRRCAARGDRVLVVSASPGVFLRRALTDLPVEVVATEFALEGGVFSGALAGGICFGEAKVTAIAARIGPQARVEEAWSDSLQDAAMMRLARSRYWLCPPADADAVRRADPGAMVVSTADADERKEPAP